MGILASFQKFDFLDYSGMWYFQVQWGHIPESQNVLSHVTWSMLSDPLFYSYDSPELKSGGIGRYAKNLYFQFTTHSGLKWYKWWK